MRIGDEKKSDMTSQQIATFRTFFRHRPRHQKKYFAAPPFNCSFIDTIYKTNGYITPSRVQTMGYKKVALCTSNAHSNFGTWKSNIWNEGEYFNQKEIPFKNSSFSNPGCIIQSVVKFYCGLG